ncbi:MAG: hypothetical protein ACYDDI_16555 [Candidatus Acidiferrales bacterium]
MKARMYQWATAAALSLVIPCVCFANDNSAGKVVPNRADAYNATVTITTSTDGRWVYVSIGPKAADQRIQDAFRVQYDDHTPISAPIQFQGEAHIIASRVNNSPGPYSLLIEPKAQKGWMFKVDTYDGTVPSGVDVENVVGIAHFGWPPNDTSAPKTHQGVVGRLGGGGCTECETGGPGATQCSIPDCSVTCSANTYACCNPLSLGGCVCCRPTFSPSGDLNSVQPLFTATSGTRACKGKSNTQRPTRSSEARIRAASNHN